MAKPASAAKTDASQGPGDDDAHGKYPGAIGRKFSREGAVLPFPGNTIVAHLSPQSPLYDALQVMHADIQKQPFASGIFLLPPSSWHMTVYDCVAYNYRTRAKYPADLPLDSSLKACHAHFVSKLVDVKPDLGPAGIGQVAVEGFQPITKVIALQLQPTSDATEKSLRGFRDQLDAVMKMTHPGHDSYGWHLTLAYMLHFWSAEEEAKINAYLRGWLERLPKTFDLGAPELCVFDDMCQFRRVYYLD